MGLALGSNDTEFIDFLSRCLEWSPLNRMTPDEALKHPWLASYANYYTQNHGTLRSSSSSSISNGHNHHSFNHGSSTKASFLNGSANNNKIMTSSLTTSGASDNRRTTWNGSQRSLVQSLTVKEMETEPSHIYKVYKVSKTQSGTAINNENASKVANTASRHVGGGGHPLTTSATMTVVNGQNHLLTSTGPTRAIPIIKPVLNSSSSSSGHHSSGLTRASSDDSGNSLS